MRFLARDQDSNVLASRGPRYRLVCRASAWREKKLDPSFRATDEQRGRVLFCLGEDWQGRSATRRHLGPAFRAPRSTLSAAQRVLYANSLGRNDRRVPAIFIYFSAARGEINTRGNVEQALRSRLVRACSSFLLLQGTGDPAVQALQVAQLADYQISPDFLAHDSAGAFDSTELRQNRTLDASNTLSVEIKLSPGGRRAA